MLFSVDQDRYRLPGNVGIKLNDKDTNQESRRGLKCELVA
jgi:hypothetical protein